GEVAREHPRGVQNELPLRARRARSAEESQKRRETEATAGTSHLAPRRRLHRANRTERGAGGIVREHRDGRGSSLEQLLRLTFVHSVRISPDARDHRYDDADDEHDHQEQHDFPSPGDWRNRNNGYPESDHAQANNRVIAAIDA